jgi:glycosyltransferase domain-containing protein
MNDPLTRLTLVIPTYNRPHYLHRLIDTYQALHLKSPILVADSSPQPFAPTDPLGGLPIQFRQFPPDTGYLNKLISALSTVKTPYVALLADDDFYLPSALVEAVSFLDDHPSYSGAGGRSYRFVLPPHATHGHGLTQWKSYPQHGAEEEDVGQRLAAHFRNYATNWYSVQRTESLQATFSKNLEIQEDLYLVELLTSASLLVRGKFKCLDRVFLLRENDAPKSYVQSNLFTRATHLWNGELQRAYTAILSTLLVDQHGFSEENARRMARETLLNYFGDQFGRMRRWTLVKKILLSSPTRMFKMLDILRECPGAARIFRLQQTKKNIGTQSTAGENPSDLPEIRVFLEKATRTFSSDHPPFSAARPCQTD